MTVNYKRQPASEMAAVDLGALITLALTQKPDRCAFRCGTSHMTHQQVLEAAQATAVELDRLGITPGEVIAVHIEHSFELAVGLCGVLMAGGCAVPIDPDVSPERQRAIIADINPRIFLTGTEKKPEIDFDAICVKVDIEASPSPDKEAIRLASVNPDTDLAFIVYTSGTSGGPKGVEITHASYVNRLQHILAASQWDDGDTDLAWTPSSFIGMLDEFFFPLLSGVPTLIAPPTARTDARVFGDMIALEAVTRFRITPSLLKAFLNAGIHDRLRGVRSIYCSGEAVPVDLQTKVHDLLPVELVSFYGATEAPGVAFHIYDHNAKPLATTEYTVQPFVDIRIADEDHTEAPFGEIGEIWISSCAVARGYRGKPELTAEKFVTLDNTRWYRTGDSGRRLDDDRIELIGRIDLSEVNIHGVRVSLPEVRDALRSLNVVDDAWISLFDRCEDRDPVLVGHYVPVKGATVDAVSAKAELASRLPTLAVPRFLISHDRFPLTANGKLDVQCLEYMAADSAKTSEPVSQASMKPQTASPTELAVLKCFEQALGDRSISLDENFFEAGGTSLEAVTLVCLVSDRFRKEIGFEELWLHPSVRELSAHVERHSGDRTARTFFHVEGLSGPHLLAFGFGVAHLSGMWPDRRLYVTPGITGDLRISLRKRLDDYVSEYIEGLRKVQPKGPYQLVGFSFCGLLAYEIARRLYAEGEEICGVALIEPVTPMARKADQSYGMVVAKEIARSIATRNFAHARRLLWLTVNSMTHGKIGSRKPLKSSYGHLVVAAENLEPFPGRVDLICTGEFPKQSLAQWQSVLQSNLRLCIVDSEKHMDVIKPESIQQWKGVIESWVD